MAPRVQKPPSPRACSSSSSSSLHDCSSLRLYSSSVSIAKKPVLQQLQQQTKKKKQPIVRVVHVFAPKLIKTEPANFRALVQKLTGNQAPKHNYELAELKATHDYDHHSVINDGCHDPHRHSDYHHGMISPNHSANQDSHEKISALELSSRPASKKELKYCAAAIADSPLSSPSSAVFNTKLNLESPISTNGFFSGSNYRELVRINDSADAGLATLNDYIDDGDANPANDFFELARAADRVIDYFTANSCDEDAYECSFSSPAASSRAMAGSSTSPYCNTESRTVQNREEMEINMGSFHFNTALNLLHDTANYYQLLLNPAL